MVKMAKKILKNYAVSETDLDIKTECCVKATFEFLIFYT